MSPEFQAQIGPFSFSVLTDATGIKLVRGSSSQTFAWDLIAGAVLVHPDAREEAEGVHDLERAKQFFGAAVDLERLKAMRKSMGAIHIAYREKRLSLRHEQIPIELSDDSFVREFQTRLGNRWLGEAASFKDAQKKLHTAPSFFQISLFLSLFLAVLILGLAFGLFALFAPVLNVLSIRQMYEDFSDGDFASLGTHLLVYVALFVFAHLLRKAWRTQTEMRKASRWPHS